MAAQGDEPPEKRKLWITLPEKVEPFRPSPVRIPRPYVGFNPILALLKNQELIEPPRGLGKPVSPPPEKPIAPPPQKAPRSVHDPQLAADLVCLSERHSQEYLADRLKSTDRTLRRWIATERFRKSLYRKVKSAVAKLIKDRT